MSYHAGLHTASNKPYAVSGIPELARYMYYDESLFIYRPYNSVSEVLSYLDTEDKRKGSPTVLVSIAGINTEYWFRNGFSDSNLVVKSTDLTGYATESWVNSRGFLTEIPASYIQEADPISRLTNDVGYITLSEVPVVDLSNYYNKTEVDNLLTSKVSSGSNISQLTNDAGYITSADIPAQQTLSFVSSTGSLSIIGGNSVSLDGRYSLTGHTHSISDIAGLQTALNNKVSTSLSITNSYGITIGGSLSTSLSLGVDTDTLDSRYLRKDINDNNGANTLTINNLIAESATVESSFSLPSLTTGTSNELLVVGTNGLIQKRLLDISGSFGIANSAGVNQFNVNLGTDLRFQGTGDTAISYNPTTRTVIINSVPGQGGGGAVTTFNGRDGAVVPEMGDYTTSIVSEGTNLYHTVARVRDTTLTGLTVANTVIIASDTILQAFGKAQGQINNKASSSTTLTVNGTAGRVMISGGAQDLTANRTWTVDLQNGIATAGTYPKVTVDSYGRVTSGTSLVAADIPNLPTSKITSGVFDNARLGSGTAGAGTFLGANGWAVPPNTTYTGSLGITLSGNDFRPSYGTSQNTIAQGNDSRINNGQTAFGWGDFRDFGLGTTGRVNVEDADNLNITGLYGTSDTFVGSPFEGKNGGNQGYLNSFNWSSGYSLQEHTQINGNVNKRYRIKNNSVWGSWVTMWDSNNHRSDADNDVRYLYTGVQGIVINASNQIYPNYGTGANTIAQGNHTHTFASLTSKPTTLSGYGITDAYTQTQSNDRYVLKAGDTMTGSLFIQNNTIAKIILQSTAPVGRNMIDFFNDGTRSGYLGFSDTTHVFYYRIEAPGSHIFVVGGTQRFLIKNDEIESRLKLTAPTIEVTSQLIAPTFTRSTQGLVPTPGGSTTTRFLREDGSWVVPTGGGTTVPTDLSLGTRNSTTVTINSSTGTNVTVPAVTTSLAGWMTAADKVKLNGIDDGANNYSLPTASTSVIGGVRVGTGLSISSGILSVISLSNSRTIWGQSFNGSANVSGALSGATTITASSTIQSTGGDIIAYSSSDERLKDLIRPFENPLEMIGGLSGNEYMWNDKQDVYSGWDYGVIAQEVEKVLPHAVTKRDNGYLAVRYEKLIPLLIEGIKALQKEINDLKGGSLGLS